MSSESISPFAEAGVSLRLIAAIDRGFSRGPQRLLIEEVLDLLLRVKLYVSAVPIGEPSFFKRRSCNVGCTVEEGSHLKSVLMRDSRGYFR